MTKTVCVISGGMDSTTLLYKLLSEGKEVKAISFLYGQKHFRELEMAKKTCEKLGVNHKVVDISVIRELVSNSALTSDIAVPEGHYQAENMKLTVVPNRNMIMASMAIAYAVNEGFNEVALGVHSGDHEIYRDCRSEFISALHAIAQIANEQPVSIYTPYLHSDKGDIVIDGIALNVNYKDSLTCYNGGEKACGRCGSCSERILAFDKAGVPDPIEYVLPWEEVLRNAKLINR